jgi:ectoine hydroxylase-related dioxygenase (phytanoyl-CoA dioxygenase family)
MRADPTAALAALGEAVREAGWAVTPPAVSAAALDALAAALTPLSGGPTGRAGVRNLLDLPAAAALARSAPVRAVAEAVLGPACVAVRGILFDKTPDANWKAPWHQDLTIAVHERREVTGFGPWSKKAGVHHVQAPAGVQGRMLAVRVHLDACGPENGPLRVLPGSHRAGKLAPADVEAWKARVAPVECVAARGGILAFRPLLLHASSAAASPGRRRVIHLEFAAGGLPGGLRWRWGV